MRYSFSIYGGAVLTVSSDLELLKRYISSLGYEGYIFDREAKMVVSRSIMGVWTDMCESLTLADVDIGSIIEFTFDNPGRWQYTLYQKEEMANRGIVRCHRTNEEYQVALSHPIRHIK